MVGAYDTTTVRKGVSLSEYSLLNILSFFSELIIYEYLCKTFPMPVAVRTKVYDCKRSNGWIAGSNPAEGMDNRLFLRFICR